MRGNAHRFIEGVGQVLWPQGQAVALVFVTSAGVVVKAVGRTGHVAQGFRQALAAVQSLHHGQARRVGPDQLGHPVQHAPALSWRHTSPRALEGAVCRQHGSVDICCLPGREPGKHPARAGVQRVQGAAIGRGKRKAINEVALR